MVRDLTDIFHPSMAWVILSAHKKNGLDLVLVRKAALIPAIHSKLFFEWEYTLLVNLECH